MPEWFRVWLGELGRWAARGLARSPRRLLVAVAVGLVLVGGVSRLTSGGSPAAAVPAPIVAAAPAPADRGPGVVVDGWLAAWLDQTVDPVGWRQGMRPFVTDEVAWMFAGMTPDKVPASSVLTTTLGTVTATTATVAVQLDTGDLTVRLVPDAGGWLVSGFGQEQ